MNYVLHVRSQNENLSVQHIENYFVNKWKHFDRPRALGHQPKYPRAKDGHGGRGGGGRNEKSLWNTVVGDHPPDQRKKGCVNLIHTGGERSNSKNLVYVIYG